MPRDEIPGQVRNTTTLYYLRRLELLELLRLEDLEDLEDDFLREDELERLEAAPKLEPERLRYGMFFSRSCWNEFEEPAAGLNSTERAVPLTWRLLRTFSRAYFMISGFNVEGLIFSLS